MQLKLKKKDLEEENKFKSCRNYPNLEFASYLECNDQYVRDNCKSVQLNPIPLDEDFLQAIL